MIVLACTLPPSCPFSKVPRLFGFAPHNNFGIIGYSVISATGSGDAGSLLLRAKVGTAAYSDLAFQLKSHHPVKVVELLRIMASLTVVPSGK
jgi:hypothetical protein